MLQHDSGKREWVRYVRCLDRWVVVINLLVVVVMSDTYHT
jgi:hypothetical protein